MKPLHLVRLNPVQFFYAVMLYTIKQCRNWRILEVNKCTPLYLQIITCNKSRINIREDSSTDLSPEVYE